MTQIGFNVSYARLVADHVRAKDKDPRPVLQALQVPACDTPDSPRWVPARRLSQALHLAADICQDPHVSLHIAQQVRPANMGKLGYALTSCTHLQDGLALFERLQALVCTQIRAEHRLAGEWIDSNLFVVGNEVPRDTALWTLTMVSRLAFARWISGRHLVPTQWRLPCPPPADLTPLQSYVGCPITFDATHAGERVPAAWLQLPNPHADAGLHQLMSALTQQQWVQQSQHPDQLTPLLMQRIATQLQQGQLPRLEQLALDIEAELGLSARQIQRRLADQGLSFKELIEDVRRAQVLAELRDTPLSLADIARRAAYAEPSSMHRAVRRWTGLTPLAVREGHPPPPLASDAE